MKLRDRIRCCESFEERERVLAQQAAEMKPLDRLLEALRACGDDQYRGDPNDPRRWTAYCPCCRSELIDARSLQIRELSSDRVLLACWRGCPEGHVLAAVRMAEDAWELPAGLVMAKAELKRLADAERLVRDLQAEDEEEEAA
jgi:hypothetical protein